jgi:hypothetical protein
MLFQIVTEFPRTTMNISITLSMLCDILLSFLSDILEVLARLALCGPTNVHIGLGNIDQSRL